tara:strand:- start:318 stop:926 length:609 start_codon:yes stop_codon:yes gene_type:complete
VFGISRNREKLEILKSSLENHENFRFISESVNDINQEVLNDFLGHNKVDVLVNNAGLLINKPFLDIHYEDYKRVMDVNFWGAFHLSKLLLKRLSKAKGQILNISSIGGVNGTSKFPGLSIYSSSKGALTILTECLHEELKDFNVRVNALALGAVQTEMLDQAFPGYKADISPKQMAEFIDSIVVKGSQILNGQVLKVTGSNP